MIRRAVVIGSNGPGPDALRFATRDAERIGLAFAHRRCGFEVTLLSAERGPQEIELALASVAEQCMDDDTLIVYFSGHGVVQGAGLLLMLDNTDANKPLTSALHVETIMRCLRYSRAVKKLLILDCCHAGMVYQDSRFKDGELKIESVVNSGRIDDGESFVAIVASDRLERTREFDEFEGSFLTTALCRALGDELALADENRDGAIDLSDIRAWLKRVAKDHNSTHAIRVPVPFVFGRERGTVYLTREPSDWSTHYIEASGHTFALLPYQRFGCAWAIGSTPVTNAQYMAFGSRDHPVGKRYVRDGSKGVWQWRFEPLSESAFNDPNQPVVCVSLEDARSYVASVPASRDNQKLVVVPPDVWDFAAFGEPYPIYDRRAWLSGRIHDKAEAPAPVTSNPLDANRYGVSDLFGNVWEWTFTGLDRSSPMGGQFLGDSGNGTQRQEMRGGSFLDDLKWIRPTVVSSELTNGLETRHYDLGFRLALALHPDALTPAAREQWKEAVHRRPQETVISNRSPAISVLRRFD